ncbi:hypothetical protein QCA50_014137 [Cerrena zonata]|uniref:Uncharacterized protein n=1 Tax=Cerrena zonata TaxID=2478898 RepID=A0AAW0FIF3_9APHY
MPIDASTSNTAAVGTPSVPKQPKKRGPDSWVQGTKLKFLLSLEDEWTTAHNAGASHITTFYDRITTQWIYMYGYDLPLDKDSLIHGEIPQNGLDKIPYLENQPENVVASRKAYWVDLRKKIARWYYGQKNIKKSEVASGLDNIFTFIHSSVNKPSRKLSPMQYYQSHYWDTHIAPHVPPAVDAAYADAVSKGMELTSRLKKSLRMTTQQEVTKTCWSHEDPLFKKQVESEFNASNAELDQKHKKLLDQPQSADDYDYALKSAGPVLHTIAQGLAKKYGMVVSILMAGPIGEDGGKIGVRSYHFGETTTRSKVSWPDFNKTAYTSTVEDFTKFAMSVFTPEECQSRVFVPGGSATSASESPATSSSALPPEVSTPAPAADARGNVPNDNASGDVGNGNASGDVGNDSASGDVGNDNTCGNSNLGENDNTGKNDNSDGNVGNNPNSNASDARTYPGSLSNNEDDFAGDDFSFDHPLYQPVVRTTDSSTHLPATSTSLTPSSSAGSSGNTSTHREPSPALTAEVPILGSTPATTEYSEEPHGIGKPSQAEDSRTPPTSPIQFSTVAQRTAATTAIKDLEPFGVNARDGNSCVTITQATAPPQSNNDTTNPRVEEPVQLRRSTRTSLPSERARESSLWKKSSPVSAQTLSSPSIDKTLLLGFPKEIVPMYTAIVNSAGLGEEWDTCLARWLLVESQNKQNIVDQLSVAHRPSEYSLWFRRGRPLTEPTKVTPEVFGLSLQKWWLSLQPVSRGFDDNNKLLRLTDIPPMEWEALRKFHRCGFSLLMIGLSWWGHAVKDESANSPHLAEWKDLVEDVDWVLQQWLKQFPAPQSKCAAAPRTKRTEALQKGGRPPKRARR